MNTFLWALRHGAIPQPAVLLQRRLRWTQACYLDLNCTVSATIGDSKWTIFCPSCMSGSDLKRRVVALAMSSPPCGPRAPMCSVLGASLQAASFMVIYDKMLLYRVVPCRWPAVAHRWRTFDVGIPDVMEFLSAPSAGRVLRQFNLSLLITEDCQWPPWRRMMMEAAFPLTPKQKWTRIKLEI